MYLYFTYEYISWRLSLCLWEHGVWGIISRKPLEIETSFQRTTNRKLPTASRVVMWPIEMTSRDTERSKSWPRYAWSPYLALDLSSSHFQMATLGHTSRPFCFVIRQFLGFFPGQVHLSKVSFDDIYLVFPWSSWLSFVTSQFPLCCLTSCPFLRRAPATWAFFL